MKPVGVSGAARGLRFGSAAPARGLQATVVNSEEVPHYELQENPSFWMENNVQVCTYLLLFFCCFLVKLFIGCRI
jgi:kinesin family protein 15